MLSHTPSFLASMERLANAFSIPGMALAWRDGDGGWGTLCIGTKVAESAQPVDAYTRFPIASCTKPFTALAVWNTLAATRTNPANPVQDTWPEFRLACPEISSKATLLDLLEHRVPLPPHTWAWVAGDVDRATFIAERLPHLDLIAPGRPPYHYSNVMYIALGQWIEVMTGQTWEHYVQRTVFDVGGMHGTLFLPVDWAMSPNAATGHTRGKSVPPFVTRLLHPAAPASELWLNSDEMAHWLEFMQPVLSAHPPPPGGRIPGARPAPIEGDAWTARGLRRDLFRGRPHYWHTGQCTGFTAFTGWLPEEEISVGIMCNASGVIPALEHLAFLAYDHMLGNAGTLPEPVPLVRAHHPQGETRETKHVASPHPLPCGIFHHPGYGQFEIRNDANGALEACLQHTLSGPISAREHGQWVWTLTDYSVSFTLFQKGDQIRVALEPALPPIVFRAL